MQDAGACVRNKSNIELQYLVFTHLPLTLRTGLVGVGEAELLAADGRVLGQVSEEALAAPPVPPQQQRPEHRGRQHQAPGQRQPVYQGRLPGPGGGLLGDI